MPPLSGEPPHLFEPEKAFPKLNVTENPKEIHTENRPVVGLSKDVPDFLAERTERTEDRHFKLDDQIRNRTARIQRARSTDLNSQT